MARSITPATRRTPKPASVPGAASDAVPVGPTATGRGGIERGPRVDGAGCGRDEWRGASRRGGGAIAIAGAAARAALAGVGMGTEAGGAATSAIAWAWAPAAGIGGSTGGGGSFGTIGPAGGSSRGRAIAIAAGSPGAAATGGSTWPQALQNFAGSITTVPQEAHTALAGGVGATLVPHCRQNWSPFR